MDEDVDKGIIWSVQRHVESIVGRLRLDTAGITLKVRRMGSREYYCAEQSSDLDLNLIIPGDWANEAKAIRVLLGEALEDCGEAKDKEDAPVDQARNSTLKWTSTTRGLDVSLLVAVEDVVNDAVSATKCLKGFFARNNTARETVRETLRRLREAGVLNSHGRKASVLQSLKTTPAALLCVALMKAEDFDREATTASQCEWLLRALSAFDATAYCVRYDWTENSVTCSKCLAACYGGDPLRIMRRGRNSAGRLTFPQWARFQYVCHRLSDLSDVGLFPSFNSGGTVDCTPSANSPRHVRLHLPKSWDWVHREEEFAVLSVWSGSGEGTLLVASGAGNDAQYKIEGYKCIVAVTWCKNYTSNPSWFPDILIAVAKCICEPNGERLDVLGLSRGVQAVMICFDTKHGRVDAVADIVNNVVLAGGCIWQRQDADLPNRILTGLARVEALWFRAPLRAVVVSEMDTNVRKRGDVSLKPKSKKEYRVDYDDFSEQVREFTQSLLVLEFAGHGAVMREGASITEAVKLTKDVPISPAHFTCGDLEEALMGPFELTPWEEAEAEGPPRLMPGSAGHRKGVFGYSLDSAGQLPRHMEKDLQQMVMNALSDGRVALWIFGNTGVGKSRRAPLTALMAMQNEEPRGVIHVLPRKLASYSLLRFYQDSDNEVVKYMAKVWNGDLKFNPTQREFVVLSTPVSSFHCLRSAPSWHDLSFIVFDEIQVKDGLVALLIVYVLDLILRRDPRARGVRVLLMTATPRGPAFFTLKSVLDKMGVRAESVTVSPCESWKPFRRLPLWEVLEKPRDWHGLSQQSKVCQALVLMTEWLWEHQKASASILIFVAGESEVFRIKNAIILSPELRNVHWGWEIMTLWGGCPWSHEGDVRDRLDEHEFESDVPAIFLVLTAGKGEDGWTPKANGMINCSEQIDLDDLGFLKKGPSDGVSNDQREGRVGRVAHSLVLHLADAIEPSNSWRMPYAEKLQVTLAAMDLRFTGDIPGLSAAQQEEVVEDLVKGDIVFKIGVVWDHVGLPSLFLSLGNPCMVIQSAGKLRTSHRASFANNVSF